MRAAHTYRGARRNAPGPFVPMTGATHMRPMRPARYVPYQIKPPVLKHLGGGRWQWVLPKQPNIYPAGWRTAAERAAGPRQ